MVEPGRVGCLAVSAATEAVADRARPPGRGEAPAGHLDVPGGGLWSARLPMARGTGENLGV